MTKLGRISAEVRGIVADVRQLKERQRLDARIRALELELGIREWDEREARDGLDPFSSAFLQEMQGKLANV